MSYTRCQDRSCPKQQTCIRYDARPMEEKGQGYFSKSPRVRDECLYYFATAYPGMQPTPLMNDNNPKEDQ